LSVRNVLERNKKMWFDVYEVSLDGTFIIPPKLDGVIDSEDITNLESSEVIVKTLIPYLEQTYKNKYVIGGDWSADWVYILIFEEEIGPFKNIEIEDVGVSESLNYGDEYARFIKEGSKVICTFIDSEDDVIEFDFILKKRSIINLLNDLED
jgi:hypothetical protein